VDHAGTVLKLLEHGRNVNAKDNYGMTALNVACHSEAKDITVTRALFQYGADPSLPYDTWDGTRYDKYFASGRSSEKMSSGPPRNQALARDTRLADIVVKLTM
jgi:hypothetical protein